MNIEPNRPPGSQWQKTHFANLIRYVPSGIYFARFRVHGKLIRKSLKTDVFSVAKLRLADMEKSERQSAEPQTNTVRGKLSFGDALMIYRKRIAGDISLKQRSKNCYNERIKALLRAWPALEKTDIRKISKSDCLDWGAAFANETSPTAFNNTLKVLRDVIEVGIEAGARYDNPAKSVRRASVKPKKLQLPEFSKFHEFIAEIENSGSRHSKPCSDLVRFLAYGGFRKTEAANIQWQDCDLKESTITVVGAPETRTKNGEIRSVPIISDMAELLARLKAQRANAKPTDRVMLVRECQKAKSALDFNWSKGVLLLKGIHSSLPPHCLRLKWCIAQPICSLKK